MARLNKERQELLEPQRIEYAKKKIREYGYEIIYEDDTKIQFMFLDQKVLFFPYSGWASGGSIIDGRGLDKLLKQI
jgi:hypothetical protein